MAQTALRRRTWAAAQQFLEDEFDPVAGTTTVNEFLLIRDIGFGGDEYKVEVINPTIGQVPCVYMTEVPLGYPSPAVLAAEPSVFSYMIANPRQLPTLPRTENVARWYDLGRKYKTPEEKFQALRTEWHEAVGPTASIAEMVMHRAYQQIVGMGPAVIPILLRELLRQPEHWFWALTAITGVDPVPVPDRGDITKMAAAWIKWGKENEAL